LVSVLVNVLLVVSAEWSETFNRAKNQHQISRKTRQKRPGNSSDVGNGVW
jgi:hypothetical protein